MDNFRIDVTAEGRDTLGKAVEIAFAHNAPGRKVESYEIITIKADDYNSLPKSLDGATALVLRWNAGDRSDRTTVNNLPFKLDAAGAADFAARWLDEADYGKGPNIDGDAGKGWRLFTGAWGHVGSDHYAVFAVVPAWAMYGK